MDTFDQAMRILWRWSRLGTRKTASGGTLIGPLAAFGPYAFLHKLPPPLRVDEIRTMQEQLHVRIPEELEAYYQRANGGYFFSHPHKIDSISVFVSSFCIYGLRTVRRQGNADSLIEQPYDLVLENQVDGLARKIQMLRLTRYSADDSVVYIGTNGVVVRFLKDNTRTMEWPSFSTWLLSELERIGGLFNDTGELTCDIRETAPRSSLA